VSEFNNDQQITFIYVSDLEVSREFYEEIMGFELVHDQKNCRIVKSAPGGYLGYCAQTNKNSDQKGFILTFVTNLVDDWYQYLIRKGVHISEAPKVNPNYHIYHFFLEDPDGYKLEIQQFLDPNWENKKG
jgi:catechol 2,3-dioxygenase-like lactoylglutathione lyase family enzyme